LLYPVPAALLPAADSDAAPIPAALSSSAGGSETQGGLGNKRKQQRPATSGGSGSALAPARPTLLASASAVGAMDHAARVKQVAKFIATFDASGPFRPPMSATTPIAARDVRVLASAAEAGATLPVKAAARGTSVGTPGSVPSRK
jgi:hypothetical protein